MFLDGYAPLLIYSGYRGRLTPKEWKNSEAKKFKKVAIKMGVPEEKILLEPKSKNTGENINFTRELLSKKGIETKKIIVVQKPFMERRTYATFMKVWPDKEFIVTSPQVSFENYPNKDLSREYITNTMVGDLQRISS